MGGGLLGGAPILRRHFRVAQVWWEPLKMPVYD